MAVEWRPKTSWVHHADIGGLDLMLWCKVNGTYAASCYPLFGSTEIHTNTIDQAKSAAVAMLRERLQELLTELGE